MKKVESVTAYIAANTDWQNELQLIREVFLDTELEETIKWGAPCYTFKGKNVVGMVGFKNHFAIWFYNGVYLKDKAKVLINAQEDVTKALRQWRFESIEEIDINLIKKYTHEAIQNQKDGKVHKPKAKTFDMPPELKDALEKNKIAKDQFSKLTPFKQKEFKEYILMAKQEATILKRVEKIIPMIEARIGLNDKYR